MESQLTLFQVEEETAGVKDIRTEKQVSKKIAYDVGELIGGSRKQLAALRKAFEDNHSASTLEEIEQYSTVLAAEIINKTELFKGFTLSKEKEKGSEPSAARAKQLLIQRVISAPVEDSKESRLQFMNAVQYLITLLEPVKTIDDLYPVLTEIGTLLRREKFNLGYYEREKTQLISELESLEKDSDKWKERMRRLQKNELSMKETKRAKEIGLGILGDKFANFFKSQSSYRSTLVNALKVESWDQLMEKKEKAKGTVRKPVWERTLPERPDRTGGAQSIVEKPEDLVTFFGFRGVEFGHYMEDEKGMEHLLRSSEAMMDLADLLSVDYKAISLQGTLAIGFGSRGRGGSALAHFEPLSNVINMTKEGGCLGIFSHEWWHSADHFLFRASHNFKSGKRGYASEPETLGHHLDSSLIALFEELIEVIKGGNSVAYYENTNGPGIRWRGTSFKSAYKRHNGDLFEAMKEKVISEQGKLESSMRFVSSLSYTSEKDMEKMKKRMEREIKAFAQALAWYHEDLTGERVDKIPYPSDKSQYFQASIILDKNRVGKYWSSQVELTARAFESYIQDKLKAAGRRSDYLVAGTYDSSAFPMGDEREQINRVFDKLIPHLRAILSE